MLYQFYEWNHAALAPWRAVADATRALYANPLNPMSNTPFARSVAALAEVFERTTRVYAKPSFGLDETRINGVAVPVREEIVWQRPFCRLVHFARDLPEGAKPGPRILIVAPMSGHYATLLRGTVEALLPSADVFITDWVDARQVPVLEGTFDLDDYVDHVIDILHELGPNTHVVGVCQPAVPVLMAVSRMEEEGDANAPASMTLMGGPIDTRINATAVNKLAQERGIDWFRDTVVMTVPFPLPGAGRLVYPGFLQLTGFMAMNLDRHLISHKDFFWHLVKGDGDPAEKHRTFYDEYNAVMDLTAEFYLQTVDEVFVKHSLPRGEMMHRGQRVDPSKVRNTALMTVEGENDDISGLGQTRAAHDLCSALPDEKRVHYMQKDVGHYGVFNGSRFRSEIAPRMLDFMRTHDQAESVTPAESNAAEEASEPEAPVSQPDAQAAVVDAAATETEASAPEASAEQASEAKVEPAVTGEAEAVAALAEPVAETSELHGAAVLTQAVEEAVKAPPPKPAPKVRRVRAPNRHARRQSEAEARHKN